jgi:hypothetical protein
MTRRVSTSKKHRSAAPALPPGLFAGMIELRSTDSFRVRLLSGEVVSATLDDAVDPELARDCLRHGRRVIVGGGPDGPVILGALQTSRPIARDQDGNVSIAAKQIRLKAGQALVIESGEAAIRLEQDGAVKLEGDRMVVDIGSLVRFLAARVEFP